MNERVAPDVWKLLDDLRQYVVEYGGLDRHSELERIDAVLSQRSHWQLVPREPTTEQWNAVWEATGTDAMRHMRKVLSIHDIRQLYDEFNRIMLAAAEKS
jgi:hypothetical protein